MLADDWLQEIYSNLPPLANLIQLLSAQGSGGSFDIQTNADAIDYDDLGYKIDILSVALSGIDGYVAEERLIEAIATREGKYSKEKPPTQLELVRAAIDEIHGKIGKLIREYTHVGSEHSFYLHQSTLVLRISIVRERRRLCSGCQCGFIISVSLLRNLVRSVKSASILHRLQAELCVHLEHYLSILL